jgi:hypothetical protein
MIMKIELTVEDIQQTLEGRDAADILRQAKAEAASRAPFLMRGIIRGMSDLQFAGAVVQRANAANQRNDPAPTDAQAFLDWAVAQGYVQILES